MPGPRGPQGPKPKIKNPGKLFARLMGFIFKKYLPACIIVVICIFVSVLANVQGTMFTKNLIDDYIDDMKYAQEYAWDNRMEMATIICNAMDWEPIDMFTSVHNYIDTKKMIIRKGACSAEEGERLIIPMNMRDGSLLCVGKGNPDWLFSAPHGAGRLMSRKQAFDTLDLKEYYKEMSGIYSSSVCEETIDESPMVYKPMQEIIDCIEPTVEVTKIIKPIYNFKAKSRELTTQN